MNRVDVYSDVDYFSSTSKLRHVSKCRSVSIFTTKQSTKSSHASWRGSLYTFIQTMIVADRFVVSAASVFWVGLTQKASDFKTVHIGPGNRDSVVSIVVSIVTRLRSGPSLVTGIAWSP
jgi:hypothetical protein